MSSNFSYKKLIKFNFFNKKLIKFIIFFYFFGLIFNNFTNVVFGQENNLLSPPKEFKNFFDFTYLKNKIINFFYRIFEKIFSWLKKIWNSYIFPFFHKTWEKTSFVFEKEIEKRKPQIKEELKEETKEFKKEIPSIFKNFWQKLKNFLKFNAKNQATKIVIKQL